MNPNARTYALRAWWSLSLVLGCAPDAPHDNPLDPSSPSYTGTGMVRGSIAALNDPLLGVPLAQVCVLPSGPIVLSRADGSYSLPALAAGSYVLVAGKEGYKPDTADILLEVGADRRVDFRLDAVPIITRHSVITNKIDSYFPGPAYFVRITAAVIDADGVTDVDSVWCTIGNLTEGMTFNPSSHSYELTLLQSQLPTNNIHWLVGKEIRTFCRDHEGALTSCGNLYVTRIIEESATPVAPSPGDTVAPAPLFEWAPAPVSFPHTLTLGVVQQHSGTLTPIWSQDGVDPDLWSLQYPSVLAPGSYFWTITIVDEFGNSSQGKPSSFIVN